MSSPCRHPFYPSLYRPALVAGVTAPLLACEAGAVFLLLFEAGLHARTVLLALFYALVCHPLAARLCSRDPLAPEIYLRSLRCADAYDPTPLLEAPVGRVDPALPGRA